MAPQERGPETWHVGEPEIIKEEGGKSRGMLWMAGGLCLVLLIGGVVGAVLATRGSDDPIPIVIQQPDSTSLPTQSPLSKAPTSAPIVLPTASPSLAPTNRPVAPTILPTGAPVTERPTRNPTVSPTRYPTLTPTLSPTVRLKESQEECQDGSDCRLGACAKAEYSRSAPKVCCRGGQRYHTNVPWGTLWEYFCGNLELGAQCWDHEACDSGWCPNGECEPEPFCVNTGEFGLRDRKCPGAQPVCVGPGGTPLSSDEGGEQCVRCVKIWGSQAFYEGGFLDDGCDNETPRCYLSNGQDPASERPGQVCCPPAGC